MGTNAPNKEKPSREELVRAIELLLKIKDTAASIKDHFLKSEIKDRFDCRNGLTFILGKDGKRPYIGVNLDHLTKAEIQDLLKAGKLTDELLLLYELGHLPFSQAYLMPLHNPNIFIIDRVSIYIDGAFNVFDKKCWTKKKGLVQKKALEWREMADIEPF